MDERKYIALTKETEADVFIRVGFGRCCSRMATIMSGVNRTEIGSMRHISSGLEVSLGKKKDFQLVPVEPFSHMYCRPGLL